MEYMTDNGKCVEVEISKTSVCHFDQNVEHRLKGSIGNNKSIILTIPGSNSFPKEQLNVG
jgi:hypothetical protein